MKKFNYRNVSMVQKKNLFQGFFGLEQYRFRHSLFAGGESAEIQRECFERGHAVGVLAYDPWLDKVVLLEQFRIGVYAHIREKLQASEQDAELNTETPWMLEIIAGIVEPGESEIDVAHREAEEEAGLKLMALEEMLDFYPSPGGSSENIRLYCACVDSRGVGGVYGLEAEGEDIRVEVCSYQEITDLLSLGKFNNATTLIAIQWLMLNHKDIREKWQELLIRDK